MQMPQLQIQQTYAKLGMETEPGYWQMHQPQPVVSVQKTPAQFSVDGQPSNLRIDQREAWNALGVGHHDDWSHNIYTQSKNVLLQGIMRRIEDGNRLSDILNPRAAIPELAEKNSKLINTIDYTTPSQFDPVEITYTPSQAIVNNEPPKLQTEVIVSPPQNQYVRGKLDVYMMQRPSIHIIPPRLDQNI